MGYWGKMIGGFAGFMAGGPFGAVVGAALGHAADEGALSIMQRAGMQGLLSGNGADIAAMLGSRETLFAISVVVLSAKLSKCDGAVKREEIDAFKRSFRIPPENQVEVGRLFDQARSTAEGFEPFAERLAQAFADNRGMLEDVLAALFAIARADGPVNRAELSFLAAVHTRFGLGPAAWERVRGARYFRAEDTAGDPYALLGVSRAATDEEVRQAWRKLMRENHPDSLAARGVPAEFVQRATAKVAEINAAWDRIKRERGL
ncbi:TerB family tellurite resistance protein [Roseomonas sp. NAR14]|uniref:TerB family tellurite resistance protein n=1 Tax=Roseomonas acroporae TaxID=2937791 RepID=A0A9X2BSG7_9PROT|nr:TerB family tellurite resistance protein [Roseomonas acroporae]MCK8783117.1 TerB family tellurite resistance protein [Roseomonas acroporae]